MPLIKLDLFGRSDAVMERVFESVATVALSVKMIAVTTTDNGTNMIKRNERWRNGRWPCAAAHMLNRVIKNTMKREQQQQC